MLPIGAHNCPIVCLFVLPNWRRTRSWLLAFQLPRAASLVGLKSISILSGEEAEEGREEGGGGERSTSISSRQIMMTERKVAASSFGRPAAPCVWPKSRWRKVDKRSRRILTSPTASRRAVIIGWRHRKSAASQPAYLPGVCPEKRPSSKREHLHGDDSCSCVRKCGLLTTATATATTRAH